MSLREDKDARLWGLVTATVRPLPHRIRPAPLPPRPPSPVLQTPLAPAPVARPRLQKPSPPAPPVAKATPPRAPRVLDPIEPRRRRRLDREVESLSARIDLHGLNQDEARAALTAFVLRCWSEHRRSLLVITGKGALGDGVLRRRVPDWLGEPPLRGVVAGLSEAHRRHGGGGALYVALKRAEHR